MTASEQDIPAGMKPWSGGDSAPEDWDGGPVLCRDRLEGVGRRWKHDFSHDDIIAYTPKPLPSPAPMVEQAGELKPCPNPWCTATTKPIPAHMKREGWRVICACGVSTFRQETEAQAIAVWNTRPAPAETEGVGVTPKDVELREKVARIIEPSDWKLVDHFRSKANRPDLEDRVPGLVAESLAIADKIIAALSTPPADAGMLREAELSVIEAARELVMKPGGLRNNGQALVVVEKADKSDPHYRLCTALGTLAALNSQAHQIREGEDG